MIQNFKKINKHPHNFLLNVDKNTLSKMIEYAQKKYYDDVEIVTDEIYDLMEDQLEIIDPNNPLLKQVGTKISKHDKTKKNLPYHMGSLDKIKFRDINHQKKLDLFTKKFLGPYIITDKLDGVSALLHIRDGNIKLYKRGDEKKGTEISSIVPYINNLELDKDIEDLTLRGELVISKDTFKNYSKKYVNERAMISGITNAKTIDPKLLEAIDFIVYDVLYPRTAIFSKQFKVLKKYNIQFVFGQKTKFLVGKNLAAYLKKREKKSKYQIDGVVIHDNSKIHKLISSGNPKYAIAFKGTDEMKKAIVVKVDWNLSRYGKSKPRLLLEPVIMPDGKEVTYVTSHNARYIFKNKLGPGAIIGLVLSGKVTPFIAQIIKKAKKVNVPQVPYEWNETNVDLILKKGTKNVQVLIKQLLFFAKTLEIKYVSISTIKKFVQLKYDSPSKILNLQVDDLLKVEGYEEKMAKKIFGEISKSRKNITLLKIMVASGIFGHGLGKRKLNKILAVHSNIKLLAKENPKRIVELINKIDGFSHKTSEKFASKLPKFVNYLDNLVKDTNIKLSKKKVKTKVYKNLSGMNIVFTGFRDKNLQSIIENSSGKVTSTVSSKTDLLVVKKMDQPGKSKINKAKELDIEILNVDQFKKEYL